jgi:general stress protein 26
MTTMLTAQMKKLITDHSAGMVASTNDNGSPSVSPKATFAIIDDTTIAFGNIRSPGTLANIRKRPAVEVCFIDVVLRKAVRASGTASIVRTADAQAKVVEAFQPNWATYMSQISAFVVIDVSAAELIWSPAYDLGHSEEELRHANLQKLNAL